MAIKKHDLDNWTPSDPSNPLKSLATDINANLDSIQASLNALSGTGGVGKGYAAAYVDAGTFVTLDNLKFSVTTGGQRGLSCATVTGTSMLAISASYAMINGGVGANATNWASMPVYTTTPSSSWFGWSFPNAGDGSTYNIQEVATQHFYRVTLMIGPGYTKNFISIERLI